MTTKKTPIKTVDGVEIPLQEEIAKDRSVDQSRLGLRRKVRIFYDLQRMRVQVGGRTTVYPKENAIQLHESDVLLLEHRAKELEKAEKLAFKDIEDHLKTIPFYANVLSNKSVYKGIGPTMAGVIMSEFDITRLGYVTKMYSYAGLAPVKAMRCKDCSRVVEETTDDSSDPTEIESKMAMGELNVRTFKHKTSVARKGPSAVAEPAPSMKKCLKTVLTEEDVFESGMSARPVRGEKLKYNAFLRTKLVGVLGPVLLKVASPWRDYYDNYKQRKAQAGWGTSDAHRHAAAVRYMVKMLLANIWSEWRKFEGLPVPPPYHEAYLDMKHNNGDQYPQVQPKAKVDDRPAA